MLPGRDAPLYHDKPYVSKGLLMRGRQKFAIVFFALIFGAVLWWQYKSPPTLDWATTGQSVAVDELQVRPLSMVTDPQTNESGAGLIVSTIDQASATTVRPESGRVDGTRGPCGRASRNSTVEYAGPELATLKPSGGI